jgi:transcriptional regulator with XRE-family HTH domain
MRKHPQTLFGRRLREAREVAGIPQDRLGVMIGIDEGCSSARISRYETGAHQPPFEIALKLAAALSVPVEYLYCRSDSLSEVLLIVADFDDDELVRLFKSADRIRRSRE